MWAEVNSFLQKKQHLGANVLSAKVCKGLQLLGMADLTYATEIHLVGRGCGSVGRMLAGAQSPALYKLGAVMHTCNPSTWEVEA